MHTGTLTQPLSDPFFFVFLFWKQNIVLNFVKMESPFDTQALLSLKAFCYNHTTLYSSQSAPHGTASAQLGCCSATQCLHCVKSFTYSKCTQQDEMQQAEESTSPDYSIDVCLLASNTGHLGVWSIWCGNHLLFYRSPNLGV